MGDNKPKNPLDEFWEQLGDKEKTYVNLSYTSYSKPLLMYFYDFCNENGIRSTLKTRDVLIQSKEGVGKFMELVRPNKRV